MRTATGVLCALGAVIASLWGCGEARPTYAIATGGTAGLFYPLGGGMASIWSRELPHVNVRAEVTGGSVTNVIQVAREESELGIALADVVSDAYLGTGLFPEPLPLRVLFSAYPNVVHIVTLAESGIERVADMAGRRISLGAAGSGTAIAAENVLTGLGLTLQDISPARLGLSETASALKDGTVDAGFLVGGLGIAAVTELALTRDVRLVALSPDELAQLTRSFPAYAEIAVPAGAYSGVEREVPALGIWSAVVVHPDMPASLAYELTCTIYRHREDLLRVSQVARFMRPETVHRPTSVPLHEGTRAYLDAPDSRCRPPG